MLLAYNFGAKFQTYIRRYIVLQKKIENNEQDAIENTYSNLPNNRVGSFNRIGRRFLEN